MARSLEEKISKVVVLRGDSLAIDLAWQDLEREANERYKSFCS